jgi:V/A-type H+-transporting ATPase subunit I
MNVKMIPVEVLGLKKDLQPALHTLRQIGCVQIDEIAESPEILARPLTMDREALRRQEELSFLAARLGGLMDALKIRAATEFQLTGEDYLDEARDKIQTLMAKVQDLMTRRERLQSELASLPRYEATLRKLLPIIPSCAHEPGNVSVGILVGRMHIGVLDSIADRVLELTSGRAEVVASDVDTSTRAMLIVFPSKYTAEIEGLLGREDVSRLRLPTELGEGPPDVVLANLHRRMATIPEEIKAVERQLAALANEWGEKLVAWNAILQDEIEANQVLPSFGETDMTFVLAGWVPENSFDKVNRALRKTIGDAFIVLELPMTPEMRRRAPVCLRNPLPVKPFESLVNLLSLPRYGHIDPARLMAFFLPIFFGMILGDVGYGFLLLLLSLGLLRKYKSGVIRDVLIVLGMGAGWSILFGFLFGEFFGNLGEHIGMRALWFDRASSEHVPALLGMTLAVGSVHITLGLVLGIWEAFRDKSRGHLLERGGMLVGLIALFLIVGVLTKLLPEDFMTPAIVGLIIGIVLLGASLGWLGLLMGPIEFIGLIGNILSYLRIAAIGLASVYLAKVANDVAGMTGNLIIGVIIAVLIHALNLVLGAFSPTIHSLRLHYVEFFRKFYEGGGRPYEPYRSSLRISTKSQR